MKSASFFIAVLFAFSVPVRAQKVPVIEKTLSNGMRLLMVERRDEPTVAGGWVAHVGSANERPGITGIAHLFEHMMFKGTPTIGTRDYQRDQEIIAEQERVRDEMRKEEVKMRAMLRRGEIDDMLKPQNKTAKWRELEKRFNELIEEQRTILVKNEYDKIYTGNGGAGMNAFTTQDMTAYFIGVPSNKLELWMWMESERLLHPVFREFYAERDVVFEERRMRTEATPLGRLEEAFESLFWESHPYGWPVVGWPSDIPSISKAQADEFYGIYYAPQNITVILVGDLESGKALAMAEKYFGRIPRGKADAPDVVTLEIKQAGEKRLYGEGDTNPTADLVWHAVPFGHRDSYPLQVLAQILSSRTGRLFKGLVVGSKVATDISAAMDTRKWAGLFDIEGEAAEGHTPEEVETAVYAELDKLKKDEVPAAELQKVKNQFAAAEYRRLSANFPIMQQIIRDDGLGDWHEINEAGPKIQAVTAADVKRVVNTYFTKENRAVAIYTRKKGAASSDADLAALSDQQRQILDRMVAAMMKDTNVDQLKKQLTDMGAQAAHADEKNKLIMNMVMRKLQERIKELETK